MEAPYEVMDPAIGEALEELPFVNKIYTYHQAFNPDAESDYGYYPESVSRLRLDGRLREVLEQRNTRRLERRSKLRPIYIERARM